jgi:hypothetical protein
MQIDADAFGGCFQRGRLERWNRSETAGRATTFNPLFIRVDLRSSAAKQQRLDAEIAKA